MSDLILREIDTFSELLKQKGNLRHSLIQGLDLRALHWESVDCVGAVFLGCQFPVHLSVSALDALGATVFPSFAHLPYEPYRAKLYSREELMDSAAAGRPRDLEIYEHFIKRGRCNAPVIESLAQRLHDHSIDNALHDLLEGSAQGKKRRCVAIMGGHGMLRTDLVYEKVARFARQLTREGYFIATGGGPGAMEAGNLGAYLADISEDNFNEALALLQKAPHYTSAHYLNCAQEIVEKHPHGRSSLAIPTWFYGHEPTNLFSLHIAKYFSNSLREEGLLIIANYGVLYAPGSAGTAQEIFMDATQNHYSSFQYISPMVFLGKEHYGEKTLLYECLRRQATGKDYFHYLHLTDCPQEAAEFIIAHPPKTQA